MVCRRYRKGGGRRDCTPHRMEEEALLELLARVLRHLAGERSAVPLPAGAAPVPGLEGRLEECRQVSGALYRDRAAGRLTEEEFQELFQENRARRRRLEALQRAQTPTPPPELDLTHLTRGTALALVERVVVEEGRRAEIRFSFRRPRAGGPMGSGHPL